MGGWIVSIDDEFVTLPFDGDWSVPDLEGRFPDQVILTMDERRFKLSFATGAIWVQGVGNYASISTARPVVRPSSVIRRSSGRSRPSAASTAAAAAAAATGSTSSSRSIRRTVGISGNRQTSARSGTLAEMRNEDAH